MARYTQKHMGVSSETWDKIDTLRQKHESWEKFFIRVLPKMKEVIKK